MEDMPLPDSLKDDDEDDPWKKPAWCDTACPEGPGGALKVEASAQWRNNWEEWKKCDRYIKFYFDMKLKLPIGTYKVRSAMNALATFFTLTLFVSAICYTG